MRRWLGVLLITVTAATAGCSTTGSNSLSCSSTEIAPNAQPGSSGPKAALDWFVKNGDSDFPKSGYELNSHSKSRYVYENGDKRISVTALPTEKGKSRLWVVTLTYDCD